LQKIAVVNQTTMLATETASISAYFKKVMIARYGLEEADYRVANTRDTLCYATKNNQGATLRLLEEPADVAIVIGGRNSSNTSHLVELCQQKLPTYFIASEKDILSSEQILHFDFEAQQEEVITHFLPQKKHLNILLTSGASCPDAIVERVLFRLLDFFQEVNSLEEVLERHALVGIKA
ncbi:MAG: 4-hydroxy-3-methylbut-2-enyl diphosphate reductase, partial [Bacteroidota bacterium]